MTELRACPGCKRHVRASDATCPFCAADVTGARPQRAKPSRLTRAAIFSAAVSTVALAGCEKEPPKPKTPVAAAPKDAAIDAAPPQVDVHPDIRYPAKPYGAPPARRRIV